MTQKAAVAAFCVAPATAHRWWHRWLGADEEERRSGSWLRDRPCTPYRQPRRLSADEEAPILRARRQTGLGPGRLAGVCRRSRSTIWKVLHRHGLSRQRRGERQTYRRYEWSRPGALLHMDVKRLARFTRPGHAATGDRQERNRKVGWEYLHVIVDDHSRLAYVERHAREDAETNAATLKRGIAWFAALGLDPPEAVMTDNAMVYRHSRRFAELLHRHGARHILTPPYTPRWTARRRDSSRPCSASGHTPTAGRAQPSACAPCHPSFATTTDVVRTAPWETGRRSTAFTTSVGRTPRSREESPLRSGAFPGRR
jgi:Integrase core domain